METTESLGYLKGLLDGLDLDANKKETKVFNAIVDVLTNLVEDIDDMTEGYYVLIEFNSKPEFPAELDRIFNITEEVMRSIIIAKE